MHRLRDKVASVTGSSSGIGKVCRRLYGRTERNIPSHSECYNPALSTGSLSTQEKYFRLMSTGPFPS